MRRLLLAALLIPAAAFAQRDDTQPPPPGIGVETIGLRPGEAKSFTLQAGRDHQLLVPAATGAANTITVGYTVQQGRSVLTASSTAGAMAFRILADPDRSGGYVSEGTMKVPAGGGTTAQVWNRNLGDITVGEFTPE